MVQLPSKTRIREILNEIVDPCSAAAGMPAGLDDMGLIKKISVEPAGQSAGIHVLLAVTHPMCLMAGVFVNEARLRIADIAEGATVDVQLDSTHVWTPGDMSPDYRERVALKRAQRDRTQASGPGNS